MALRVLIVQSDVQTIQPLVSFFKHRGDETWQAGEIKQGLALIDKHKPDLLFLDIQFNDGDWGGFVRSVRSIVPEIKIIMTNKVPELQREIAAREMGITVFLRQPYSAKWIQQALDRLRDGASATQPVGRRVGALRIPVQMKITLPYLLLAILFTLASAYLISKVALENVEERFYNQLVEAGRQSTDWMVGEEDRLLGTLRLVSNTSGLASALTARDAETLRTLVLPVAANAGEDEIILLDPGGKDVLSLRHLPGGGQVDYEAVTGSGGMESWGFVTQVLAVQKDQTGDKFAGVGQGKTGPTFYVSGPIYDSQDRLAGAVLVGKSLDTLVREMSSAALGDITLYGLDGMPVASTLFAHTASEPLTPAQVSSAIDQQDQTSQTRNLTVSTIEYAEIIGPWEARGGSDIGVIGISLARTFLVRTSQITQLQIFLMVAGAILLAVFTGLYLSSLITRPLMRLVSASTQVAQGNLEVKVDANGNDEVAVLARSFNYMVAGLQEGSIYRDLLGRTVSPEVREQLRQTFTSGGLKLEGQEAVATVMYTDIRGFTNLAEKVEPATVFQWLNEYFGQMVPIISNHGGVVNKFDGDAMLAFFGVLPSLLSPEEGALAALEAAAETLAAIDCLNEQRVKRGEPQLITGIGINTGVLIAGGLGTSDRIHYTIIGDTVNVAQRIENLSRETLVSSGILVSQATYTALGANVSRFGLKPMGVYQVKGKDEPLQVYHLVLQKIIQQVG